MLSYTPQRALAETKYTVSRCVVQSGELRIGNSIQVSEWEKPAQEAMADLALSFSSPSILEIGYGFGFASNRIRSHSGIHHHILVEAHPAIFIEAIKTVGSDPRTTLVYEFWEKCYDLFRGSSFDSIIFDPCPLDEDTGQSEYTCDQIADYISGALPLLSPLITPGGIFLFLDLSNNAQLSSGTLEQFGFVAQQKISVSVNIPEFCPYASGSHTSIRILRKG